MSKHIIFFIFMILFLIIGKGYSYEYKGVCKTRTIDFLECLDAEYEKYDSELNILYRNLINIGKKSQLQKVEKLWIKFKEEDCDYMAREVNMGVEYQPIYKACLINHTRYRIEQLKRSYFFARWFNKNA